VRDLVGCNDKGDEPEDYQEDVETCDGPVVVDNTEVVRADKDVEDYQDGC
jgi:hypothetical protein